MAAAVVSGAVAVLKERGFNARQIRPVLQLTSERNRSGLVTSGAGALNLLAAVKANGKPTLIAGESVTPSGLAVTLVSESAQARTVVWGAHDTVVWGEGDTVVWGESDTVVWGEGETVVWGEGDTVVWGERNTVVLGRSRHCGLGESDTVVWGEADTVVWAKAIRWLG